MKVKYYRKESNEEILEKNNKNPSRRHSKTNQRTIGNR
jgi:hypothetical protein